MPATTPGVVDAYLDVQRDVLTRDLRVLDDAEAVHDLRVAARRYRSVLRVFAELFDDAQASWLDAELAWYAGVLGELRDLHVLRDHLATAIAELAAELALDARLISDRVDSELRARERRARRKLHAVFVSRRYERLIAGVVATAPVAAGDRGSAEYLHAAQRKARKRLRAAKRYAGDDPRRDPAMHSARKAAKRARYTAEAVAPVLGGKAAKAARHWRREQNRLGAHQDGVVATGFVRGLVRDDIDFALGVLWGRQRQR